MDSYLVSAGVRIRYRESGAGEPVVLVHGFTGRLEDWFECGMAPALAERYRVIAFDCRGHGGSDKPHDPALYGPEMGYDIVRLLDQLGVARAHGVGYSMGAHILAQLLVARPERLLTATLGGAPGRLGWSDEDEARVAVEAAELEDGRLTTQIRRLDPSLSEHEVAVRSRAILAGQDRLALAASRRANRSQAVHAEELRAVRVPTLGVVGAQDPYSAGFQRLKAWMPQAQIVVIPDATHASTERHPAFRQAVLDFLSTHATRPGSRP